MSRVVLDTNVLVSGLLSETGPPGQIVSLIFHGEIEPVISAAILSEYREVLARAKFGFLPNEQAMLLEAIESFGLIAEPLPWPVELPDADDEPYLAVAEVADAPLVTGNLRHFPKRLRRTVSVLSPKEFINQLRNRP